MEILEQKLENRGIRLIKKDGEIMLATAPEASEICEEISKEELEQSLISLINSEDNCLALAKGKNSDFAGNEKGGSVNDDFFLKYENSPPALQRGIKPEYFAKYDDEQLLRQVSFTNKKGEIVYVSYYHGRCKE